MKRFSQRVLSRGKDSSKSSKKNKDSKDGTASPSSRDSNQSPVLTPTSSTSTLNDPRNKPLPQNNAGHGSEHGSASQPSNLSNVTQAGNAPDRFGSGGASSPNGGNANSRLPPTVIISPTPGHVPPPGAAETMPHDLAPPQSWPEVAPDPSRNR
ncbi:serine/threonine-protein phosphatase 2A 56 kDa regulatory subunit delta isoform [Fusarium falciforme]